MIYKTNYELHSRGSLDSRRSPPPPDELLSPLATLYPHVAALQPQYDHHSCTFTGYHRTGYWAAAYTTQPIDEPSLTRRSSDHPSCRFVSKLRRFHIRRLLSRDDFKYRRGSEATARTA